MKIMLLKVHGPSMSYLKIQSPLLLRYHRQAFNTRSYSSASQAQLQETPNQSDRRSRLSQIWAPSGGIAASSGEDAHSKLVRAGFLRQAHSGIFHILPLGRRIQQKIERLVDRHMESLGASKLDLSSISSQDLWTKSGRLTLINSELFLFEDRRETGYLLSPTHEEEITNLVAGTLKSYKELPIRLYQISRKYRDELRPRHGLLRSREFVMKDLYTFDLDVPHALQTYHAVCNAYRALFDELKVPYLVAEANSGDMGGNLSHEFHFPTPVGEDHIISCRNCDYVANEELAECSPATDLDGAQRQTWSFLSDAASTQSSTTPFDTFTVWRGITQDRSTLVNVWVPLTSSSTTKFKRPDVNTHAVKIVVPDLDPSVDDAVRVWDETFRKTSSTAYSAGSLSGPPRVINLIDQCLPISILDTMFPGPVSYPVLPPGLLNTTLVTSTTVFQDQTGNALNLLRIHEGDRCPRCHQDSLTVSKAIELGHTFFLGTRYSEPLEATVTIPTNLVKTEYLSPDHPKDSTQSTFKAQTQVPVQMGCHGIGISRMIGAVAETLVDKKGLNWPRVIAPYEIVVVPAKGRENEAIAVYDMLAGISPQPPGSHNTGLDLVLDDRDHAFSWKMHDADLVGYPVIVIVGKRWDAEKACEVQCRRLDIKKSIPVEELPQFINSLLSRL